MLYIPEGWTLEAGGRTPEKPYVWSIICTLEPQWIGENMERIRSARHNHRLERQVSKPPDMKIDPFW